MGGMLGSSDTRRASLRELFAAGETVLAPGCYDALGARLVEEAGFPAAYMTGFGSAASQLGRPDIGLMSLPEMVDNARRIAGRDRHPGHRRRRHRLRQPDQRDPHRARVRGGRGRRDPHRGPGHAQEVRPHGGQGGDPGRARWRQGRGRRRRPAHAGLPDHRAHRRSRGRGVRRRDGAGTGYREAGADALFVEAPQSEDEIPAVARAFPDVPLLFNYAEGGMTPAVGYARPARARVLAGDLPDHPDAGRDRGDARGAGARSRPTGPRSSCCPSLLGSTISCRSSACPRSASSSSASRRDDRRAAVPGGARGRSVAGAGGRLAAR